MRKILNQSVVALGFMTLLTGVAYPLVVTFLAQVVWKREANGSLVKVDDKVVGSELIAQEFVNPIYFWPRPSATSFGTMPGGASNLGPTSKKLWESIAERRKVFSNDPAVPFELLMASGSGLDPHISPMAARYQLKRVAKATGLAPGQLDALIDSNTEGSTFGIFGKERVNVLKLNLAIYSLKK